MNKLQTLRLSGWFSLFFLLSFVSCFPAYAERIKDLASIQGVRSNQVFGYGFVVGLDGSGDQTTQTPFTVQSVVSMLAQMGVNLPPGTNLQLKNVAAVIVTAKLPSFAKPGQMLDVTVSSMGNAKSLRGGTLLLTPLKGADGQIYGMAQGNILLAGAGAAAAGSKVQINQLNAGRIPAGATVERMVASALGQGDYVNFELENTDFSNARVMADTINANSLGSAEALDGCGATRTSRQQRTVHFPRRRSADNSIETRGESSYQRAHRLGGDEPVGDVGNQRGSSRQPISSDQQRAIGEPACPLRARADSGRQQRPDPDHFRQGATGHATG
jgi:flagellar basal body P-ring protein FlgI